MSTSAIELKPLQSFKSVKFAPPEGKAAPDSKPSANGAAPAAAPPAAHSPFETAAKQAEVAAVLPAGEERGGAVGHCHGDRAALAQQAARVSEPTPQPA